MKLKLLVVAVLLCICNWGNAQTAQLVVTSPEFKNDGLIPSKYSCEGENTNPPLQIKYILPQTKSLAIILHDPDAPMKGGFTHWVLWNIDPKTINIPEHFAGGTKGWNSTKKDGYVGMCPPSGTHHYHFMVYALDAELNLPDETGKAELEKAINGHILGKGELVGLYKRKK
jgi:Raf kinase inhibitor-like YbhB/YbcL family protein